MQGAENPHMKQIDMEQSTKCDKIKLIEIAFFLIEKRKVKHIRYKYGGGVETYGTRGIDYYK